MVNPYKYLGKATVKADGKEFKMSDVEFVPSGIVREDILEGRGFSEKEQGGYVKGKLNVNGDTDPEAINAMDDCTIVVDTDIGRSWSCPHAWHEQPEAITKDGMDITFKFAKSERIS